VIDTRVANQKSTLSDTELENDNLASGRNLLEAIGSSIDRLNRLGVAIRHSSTKTMLDRGSNTIADFGSIKNLAMLCLATLYPDSNENLREQLSMSMAIRYNKLATRKQRQDSFKQRRVKQSMTLPPIQEGAKACHQTTPLAELHPPLQRREYSLTQRSRSSARSELSSLHSHIFRQKYSERSDAGSTRTGTSSVQINKTVYPKPPQGVSCEWCYESLSQTDREGDKWKYGRDT
jgi:hypothetical protein